MNHEEVLAVLPDSKEEAKSIKEIARQWGWRYPLMWTGSGQSGDWSGL